jgi:cytochrome b6-f complex iron-sulfur subunit
MPEDQRKPDNRITRRRACQVAGAAACSLAAGGAVVLTADFLHPRVLFEPPTRFTIGPPEVVEVGKVLTNETFRAYIIRRPEGFHALSSVCTHLGCVTRYQPDEGLIVCPCHGSRFSLEGEVLAGPAPRSLLWLQMGLSPKGLIDVETTVEVPEGTVFKL